MRKALPRLAFWTATTTIIALVMVPVGCKKTASSGETSPEATGTTPAATYTQIDYNSSGTISGTIKFAKKAPPRIEIDMAQDPACSLSADANYSEQYMVKDGKLQNVFVYVKDGLGNKIYPAPSTPVVLDQKGCRYVPHVIGVMVGQPVEFTNSDPTMHNIHTTGGQPGESGDRYFAASEGRNDAADLCQAGADDSGAVQ